MSLLKGLTYISALLWILGGYSILMGDQRMGTDLVNIFGSLTILLVLIQCVGWLKSKHGAQISKFAVSIGHCVIRSRLMLLGLAGTALAIWMMAYETLPGGWQHRNRITGFVCNIDRSCWFSAN